MKFNLSLIILLVFNFLFGQTFEFNQFVSVQNIPKVVGYKHFSNLMFRNENDRSYTLYISDENTAVIRDEKNRLTHFYAYSVDPNKSNNFDYQYSIRMIGHINFDENLYEINSIDENSYQIRKFKNKRRKKIDYEFVVHLTKSDFSFLFVQFEKSAEISLKIGDLLQDKLDPNSNYQITSFEYENAKGEVNVSQIEKFKIELPKNLNFNSNFIKTH